MSGNSNNSSFIRILFSVALMVAVSSFFLPLTQDASISRVFPLFRSSDIFSYVISFLFLIVILISMYYVNNKCFSFSSYSSLLPALYLLLVLSNPSTLLFSKYHILALLMIWSVYFIMIYITEKEEHKADLFLAVLLSSISALIFPPLVWIVAALFVITIMLRPSNFLNYSFIYLGAIVTPFIYLFAFDYFFSTVDFKGYFTQFHEAIKSVAFYTMEIDVITIVYYLFLTVLFIRSLVFLLNNNRNVNTVAKRTITMGCMYVVMTLLIFTFYKDYPSAPIELVFYFPFSIICFYYFVNSTHQKESRAFLLLLLIFSIIYRISLFF